MHLPHPPFTRILILFSLVLPTGILSAQADYQLFRPGVQYLYANPDYARERITDIVTELYGVRTTGTCDSLYSSLEVDPENGCVSVVPSPFGTLLCQRADSTVAYFSANDSLVLYPAAAVGTRWLARRTGPAPVYAEVTALEAAPDAADDQLKTITFSAADGTDLPVPLVISARRGVLSSPKLYRIAEETAPLTLADLQLPPEADYGSVAVGDVYHLESVRGDAACNANGCVALLAYTQRTAEILSVETVNDTVRFTYRGDVFRYRVPRDGGPAQDSVLIRDTLQTGFVTTLPAALQGRQPGALVSTDAEYREMVVAERRACGLLSLRVSTTADFTEDTACGFDTGGVDAGPGPAYTAYVPFTLDSLSTLTGPYVDRLVYRDSEAGTCGTPYDFADITIAVRDFDPELDRQLRVYPNPLGAGTSLTVGGLPTEDGFSLQLYDGMGRLILQRRLVRNSTNLPTDGLKAGLYILVLRQRGRAVARRPVIVR